MPEYNAKGRAKEEKITIKAAQKRYNNSMGVSPTNKKVNYKRALRASKAIKRMTRRRPYIAAIAGPAHLKIVESLKGNFDCKNGHLVQVFDDDNDVLYYTSADIETKVAGFNTTVNRQYQKIRRKIDEIALFLNARSEDLKRNREKMEMLDDPNMNPVPEGKENLERFNFLVSEDKRFLETEYKVILEEISIIREEISSIDDQMKQFQNVAKAYILENISHYYKGVLKANTRMKKYSDLPTTVNHPVGFFKTDERVSILIQLADSCLQKRN